MATLACAAQGLTGQLRAGASAAKHVHRLMRAAELQGRHHKAWKVTTVAGEKPVNASDLINRNFTAAEPNTAWCEDITYITNLH